MEGRGKGGGVAARRRHVCSPREGSVLGDSSAATAANKVVVEPLANFSVGGPSVLTALTCGRWLTLPSHTSLPGVDATNKLKWTTLALATC